MYETKYPYQTQGDKDHVPEAAKNPEMEQYIALNKSEFEGLDFNGIDVISLSYAEPLVDQTMVAICGSDRVEETNREFKFRNLRMLSIKEGKEHVMSNYLSTNGFGDFTHVRFVWINPKTQGILTSTDTGNICIYPFERTGKMSLGEEQQIPFHIETEV